MNTTMSRLSPIDLKVLGAESLRKTTFYKPSPFAYVTVEGSHQKKTTLAKRKTANPTWGARFTLEVTEDSEVTIQVLDEKKEKPENRKLGFVTFRIGDVMNLTYTNQTMLVKDLTGTLAFSQIHLELSFQAKPEADYLNIPILTVSHRTVSGETVPTPEVAIGAVKSPFVYRSKQVDEESNAGPQDVGVDQSFWSLRSNVMDRGGRSEKQRLPFGSASSPSSGSLNGETNSIFDKRWSEDVNGGASPAGNTEFPSTAETSRQSSLAQEVMCGVNLLSEMTAITPSCESALATSIDEPLKSWRHSNGAPEDERSQRSHVTENPAQKTTIKGSVRVTSPTPEESTAGNLTPHCGKKTGLLRRFVRNHFQIFGTKVTNDLPPGWERRLTAKKRVYYVDNIFGTTTWSHPIRNLSDHEDPPMGWVSRITFGDREYYYYHDPDNTTWVHRRSIAKKGHEFNYESLTDQQLDSIFGPLSGPWEIVWHREGSTNVRYYRDWSRRGHITKKDPRISEQSRDQPKTTRNFTLKMKSLWIKPAMQPIEGTIHIDVDRYDLLDTGFRTIYYQQVKELKKRLVVRFTHEPGYDATGVGREYFTLLSEAILNPSACLFQWSSHNSYTYTINPNSYVNPSHLAYFEFAGRVVGMAVFHRYLISGAFVRSFYKQLLGMPVGLSDMEDIDGEIFNSMTWLVNQDITDMNLGLSFSVDCDNFGAIKTHDLVPNGRELEVNESNKRDYVHLLCKWWIIDRVQNQFDAFKRGFHAFVPPSVLTNFDAHEMELLLSGVMEIDIDDWRRYTKYSGYSKKSNVIKWFWSLVMEMEPAERAHLLQFVTGSSRVPTSGFCDLRGAYGKQLFTINRPTFTLNNFPNAHTCFNRLDLPNYHSRQELQKNLELALNNYTGFGIS
ncbi:E3 ubiquitin-protein ligase Rsp5p [Diutina catenulata]